MFLEGGVKGNVEYGTEYPGRVFVTEGHCTPCCVITGLR